MSKVVRLTIAGPDSTETRAFRHFPVRIGRDPDLECQVGYWYVSRKHARIDLEGGELVLVDEGSRHGTLVRQGAERIRGPVVLREVGGRFRIGAVAFHAELVDASPTSPSRAATSEGAETGAPRAQTRTYSQEAVDPALVDTSAVIEQARDALFGQRDQARDIVLDALAEVDETKRTATLQHLLRSFPELLHVPALAELASSCGVVTTRPDAALGAHEALSALRARHLPRAQPLEEPAAVEDFVRRLDIGFDGLLEGVAALLFAHQCEIGRAGEPFTTEGLATTLLGDARGPRLLREAFVAMVTHHATITREALDGARALLADLAPETFAGIGWRPLAARTRWTAYVRRHRELSELDSAGLAKLFGPSFARACRALAGQRTTPSAEGPPIDDNGSPPHPPLPLWLISPVST